MIENPPYSKEEQEIIDLTVQIQKKFNQLPYSSGTGPSRAWEIMHNIHGIQAIINNRLLHRLYPNDFNE